MRKCSDWGVALTDLQDQGGGWISIIPILEPVWNGLEHPSNHMTTSPVSKGWCTLAECSCNVLCAVNVSLSLSV